MNPSSATVSPLRQRMLDDMRMRNLAPKTQSAYIRAVRSLAGFLRRPPDTASAQDLRLPQLHLVDRGTSAISLNATLTGLKFFFDVTLDRHDVMARVQPMPTPRKLPVVLSREEVAHLIAAAPNVMGCRRMPIAETTSLPYGVSCGCSLRQRKVGRPMRCNP